MNITALNGVTFFEEESLEKVADLLADPNTPIAFLKEKFRLVMSMHMRGHQLEATRKACG